MVSNTLRNLKVAATQSKACFEGLEESSKTTVGDFLRESEIEVYDQAGEIWNDILAEGGKIVEAIER